MTTSPAVPAPAAAGQHLAAIADSLSARGFTSRLTQTCGNPVLTVDAPGAGPEPDTISVHPDPYASPGPAPQLDCTCIWTPAPGASPQATAATIAAILTALRPDPPEPPAPRPAARVPARRIRQFQAGRAGGTLPIPLHPPASLRARGTPAWPRFPGGRDQPVTGTSFPGSSTATCPRPSPRPPAADPALPARPLSPDPSAVTRLTAILASHPGWSAFYDKRYRLWRAAEDDPASTLYAETPDPDAIIAYITSHA